MPTTYGQDGQQKKPATQDRVRGKVRAVVCPRCGAGKFARCIGVRGARRVSNHAARVVAYREERL